MSDVSIIKLQVSGPKRSQRNWSVISASSRSRNSENYFQKLLHMIYEPEIVHKLYRKLLVLYPQTFKEQLGESMEQTFQDLWNEKQQTKKELFGFVLWTFVETAIGIFREHLLLISSGGIMQTVLKTIGSPALISLLLILPLMIMEVVNRRNFNEDFPIMLFFVMWLNLLAISLILLPIVLGRRTGKHDVANPVPAHGNTL